MKKDFILKVIVLPVILALVTGIVFFFILSERGAKLFPAANNVNLAYYDNLSPDDEVHDDLAPNVMLGSINSNGELKLRYKADYSNLIDCASLTKGSADFGATGCNYIKINSNNVSKISTSDPLTVIRNDGEYTYEYAGEKLVESENEALSLAPEGRSSLIVYYRVTKGTGLTDEYYALIYKGVD